MRTLKDLGSMDGRFALVTGGAGHIGRAIAAALLQAGCHVFIVDRNADALSMAASVLQKVGGGRITTLVADLEAEADRVSVFEQVAAQTMQLDVLINNAGFVGDSVLEGWVVPFAEQSITTWRRALEVNLTAPFHLTQLFSALLRAGGRGSVINIGSIYGVVGPDLDLYEGTPMANPAAYAASKGGLLQLTRWLATNMAPDVRVNSISPGGLERGQPAAFVEKYVARTPLGRMGTEEDFMGAVLFLASDLSAWVTGHNIMVDGGWTAW